MKPTYITAASLLLLVAALMPATAYHIDGYVEAVPNTPGAYVPEPAADWVTTLGLVTICESMGPLDDRNAGVPHAGVGGLCAAGRSDATGTPAPAAAPNIGDWTQLDVCDAATATRPQVGITAAAGACSSGTSGSLLTAVQAALGASGTAGRTNAHGFTGRVGVFTCFVATDTELLPVVDADQALFYEELYAWWSYTAGDGYYTPAEAAGAFHYTAEDGIPDNVPAGLVPAGFDSEAAFHGHATVFVLPDRSEPGASVVGSVDTQAVAAPGANAQPCGSSPVGGPVVVADSGNAQTVRACMDIGFFGVRTTYPCRVGPLGNACTPPVGAPNSAMAVGVLSFDTVDAFTSATGRMSCAGPAGGQTLPANCSTVLPLGMGCTGVNAAIPPHALLGAGPTLTCTRDMPVGAAPNDFPHDADTVWVVACVDI